MSDYKLILIDNTDKTEVRYRKKNDRHWQTLYLAETDVDKIIESILNTVKEGQ